jgi:hypothetical protein
VHGVNALAARVELREGAAALRVSRCTKRSVAGKVLASSATQTVSLTSKGDRGSLRHSNASAIIKTIKTAHPAKVTGVEIWFRIGRWASRTLTRVWDKRGLPPCALKTKRYMTGLPVRRRPSATSRRSQPGHAGTASRFIAAFALSAVTARQARHSRRDGGLPFTAESITKTSLRMRLPALSRQSGNDLEYLRNQPAITVFDDYDDIVDKTSDAVDY